MPFHRAADSSEDATISDDSTAIALARRAASGDTAATQALLTQVRPAATRLAVGVLGARHPDLDDVLQQALLAFVQALPAFRGECHPAGYAARIALRLALRQRSRQKLILSRSQLLAQLAPEPPPIERPSDLTRAERRRGLLRTLLGDLPAEQAETLALRVVLGYSLEEIARTTDAPVNTVRSRIRLAKVALRKAIAADPEIADELGVST